MTGLARSVNCELCKFASPSPTPARLLSTSACRVFRHDAVGGPFLPYSTTWEACDGFTRRQATKRCASCSAPACHTPRRGIATGYRRGFEINKPAGKLKHVSLRKKMELDDDDFEYYVNFPSPAQITADDADKPTADSHRESPAIILLGWGGCSDKHLSKYSDIYNSRGYATLRYVYPAKHVICPNPADAIRSNAVKLVETIQDLGLDEQPLVLHTFSNAGAMMLYMMNKHLKTLSPNSIRIYGCIFDSGPAMVNFMGRVKVAATLIPGGVVKRYFTAFLVTLCHFAKCFVDTLLFWKPKSQRAFTMWNLSWHELAEDDGKWPQLFLFSKADTLCDYRCIERFVTKRKEKGVDVTTFLWDDTPHVGHLMVHRETYMNQVFQFVQKCMDKAHGK